MAVPDEPSGCAPGDAGETGAGCCCSVAADDPPPLAEGTEGCGAGWSSPKGRPPKTTNATKRRTAPNATAVRLTRSRQRFASPTVTASCSAASLLLSRPPRRSRRLNGPPPTSRSAVNRSRAANHVTAAPARPHRFVPRSNVLLSRPPRRSRRLNGPPIRIYRAVLSTSRPAQCCQPVVRGEPPHRTPVRPHSFVQRTIVLLSRPPRRNRRLNGHRIRIWSRSAVNVET